MGVEDIEAISKHYSFKMFEGVWKERSDMVTWAAISK